MHFNNKVDTGSAALAFASKSFTAFQFGTITYIYLYLLFFFSVVHFDSPTFTYLIADGKKYIKINYID